jgi:hypothetical protein
MKNIYIALRYFDADDSPLIRVFANLESANAFKKATVHPYRGFVLPVDLSRVESHYIPRSPGEGLNCNIRTTYYCFRKDLYELPAHWNSSLDISRHTRNQVEKLCWGRYAYELKERSLIPFFLFNYDFSLETVFVIREKIEGAFSLLRLSESFPVILKGSGTRDRGELIHLVGEMKNIRHLAEHDSLHLMEQAGRLLDDFWERFEINESPLPEDWAHHWQR